MWIAGREHTRNRLKCKLPQNPSKVKQVWFVNGTACAWNLGMINCLCLCYRVLFVPQDKANTLGSMLVLFAPLFYYLTYYQSTVLHDTPQGWTP